MTRIMDITEQITYSTVLIRCYDQNNKQSMGTGFFVDLQPKNDNDLHAPFVITNAHVVANSVRTEFEICKADENGDPIDTQTVSFKFENHFWIHHPDPLVDLCCAPLKPIFEKNHLEENLFYRYLQLEYIASESILKNLFAIEEVIMVGYPRGISDECNHKPIVRRGITASHPNKDFQGKKETLLDISVFPGSSGSPVFICNHGVYSTMETTYIGSPRILLLGIVYGLRPDLEQELLRIFKDESHLVVMKNLREINLNLAFMIKAERIFDFAQMLQREMAKNEAKKLPELSDKSETKE